VKSLFDISYPLSQIITYIRKWFVNTEWEHSTQARLLLSY